VAAADYLSRAAALDADAEDIWLQAAYAADLAGDPGRALMLSEKFVRRHPESVKARFALAKLYHRLNFPGNAYVHIKPVVKAEPENVKAWHLYGLAARWAQRPREAVDALATAARLDPQNADIQLALAAAQSDISQYEAAEKAHRRAVALRPGDPMALSLLAGFLLDKRDNFPALRREAVEILRALLDESPRNSFALYHLGVIALKENNPEEAVSLLRAALREEPERDIGWNVLGRAYQRLGRQSEAEAALAKGKELYARAVRTQQLIDAAGAAPNDLSLHLRLARHYAAREDSASAALNEYLICHRIAPKNAAVKAELEAFSERLRKKGKMPSLDFLRALADATAADARAYRPERQTR
jgi:cytochrome c-type biogenesis protein CcmH/NrfG